MVRAEKPYFQSSHRTVVVQYANSAAAAAAVILIALFILMHNAGIFKVVDFLCRNGTEHLRERQK
jgi:hypothetical protein